MNLQIFIREIKQQPLLKFSALIIGFTIWFFLSKNELVEINLPLDLIFSKPINTKLLMEDKFIAKVELPRIKAWQNIFSNFKIFFDVDNLDTGDHNLNSSAALLISDFPVKVISHNLPEYLKLNIY
jgi:hypothetical protein